MKQEAALAGLMSGVISIAAVKAIETIKIERKKRAKIKQEAAEQIKAHHIARDEMLSRIDSGMYDKISLDQLKTDFEFEVIRIREGL